MIEISALVLFIIFNFRIFIAIFITTIALRNVFEIKYFISLIIYDVFILFMSTFFVRIMSEARVASCQSFGYFFRILLFVKINIGFPFYFKRTTFFMFMIATTKQSLQMNSDIPLCKFK